MVWRSRTRESLWLEEPIRHDDYEGDAPILPGPSTSRVQIGENFNGPEAMLEAVAAAGLRST